MYEPADIIDEGINKALQVSQMFEDKESKANILELAQTLKLKNDRQTALEAEAKTLKSELAKEGEQLYSLMIEANMPSVGIENKTLAPKLYRTASIPTHMREEGHEQLRKTGKEAFIEEKTNAQTIGADFRQMVETGEAIKEEIDGEKVWVYADGPLKGKQIAFSITEKKQIGITSISAKKKGKMKEMRGI